MNSGAPEEWAVPAPLVAQICSCGTYLWITMPDLESFRIYSLRVRRCPRWYEYDVTFLKQNQINLQRQLILFAEF